jgi:hypothetical protein
MGYDKYGLDWTLWESMPTKPENKEPTPLQSLHSRDTLNSVTDEKKVPITEEIDLSEDLCTPPLQEKLKPTCTLANAQFLPDETTDFNKPCIIVVDVEGKPSGSINFALHATYKGTDYDLKHEQSAPAKDGKAQTTLKLFFVDQHYDDLYVKGECDTTVEYYAVVSNKAAREIKSEVLRMPHISSEGKILEAYFEDKEGKKTEITQTNQNVFFVLVTENLLAEKSILNWRMQTLILNIMGQFLKMTY